MSRVIHMGTCSFVSTAKIDPDGWYGVFSDGFAGDVWSLGVAVMECCISHFPLSESWGETRLGYCNVCNLFRRNEGDAENCISGASRPCEEVFSEIGVKELISNPFVTNFRIVLHTSCIFFFSREYFTCALTWPSCCL